MLSINGVYENGRIRLLEPVPFLKRAKVIVTIVDEMEFLENEGEADIHLLDDLVGVVAERPNGSEKHDHSLASRENGRRAGLFRVESLDRRNR